MHVYQRNRKNSMQGHGTRVIKLAKSCKDSTDLDWSQNSSASLTDFLLCQ